VGADILKTLMKSLESGIASRRVALAASALAQAFDLDLISDLKAIPDARIRRGVRIPAWYLQVVAVLGSLSRCQSLRDPERFVIRHHSVLTQALGLELRRLPSDSAFRHFFHQMDVAALCAAIRDWTNAQIPAGAANLDHLVCDGETWRGSIEAMAGGGSAPMAQVTLYSPQLAWRSASPAAPVEKTTSGRCSVNGSASWNATRFVWMRIPSMPR
jgi:hypothetical protein